MVRRKLCEKSAVVSEDIEKAYLEVGREGRRTPRQEGVHTSCMVLEVHHSERLPYGHHRGEAGRERRVDKHRAVQEEDMQSH